MNTPQKQLAACMITGAVVVSAVKYIHVHRIETRKRAEIRAQLERDLAAIKQAGAVVQNRIDAGHFRNRSLVDVLNDFEFEVIAAHYQD